MQIEINKEVVKKIRKQGCSFGAFLFLLSLYNQEDLFDVDDFQVYQQSQDLIIKGLIIEDFDSEEENLFKLTPKGQEFVQNINN